MIFFKKINPGAARRFHGGRALEDCVKQRRYFSKKQKKKKLFHLRIFLQKEFKKKNKNKQT